MDWGMENRLSQLMPNGKCFFMPIDHGYFQGPTRKLEKPGETVKPLLPYADALFVTRGVLRAAIDPLTSKPIVLRVSGCTSMVGKDLANEELTTSIAEIIRLNASAVGLSIFIGSEYEKETLKNLATLVNMCEDYGIPVMAVTAVGRELDQREARYLKLMLPHRRGAGRQGGEDVLVPGTFRSSGKRLSGAGDYGRRAQVRDRTGGPGICA